MIIVLKLFLFEWFKWIENGIGLIVIFILFKVFWIDFWINLIVFLEEFVFEERIFIVKVEIFNFFFVFF